MGKTWYWLALASLLAACGETQEPPVGLVVDRDAIRDQELERLAVEDVPMTLDPSMPAAPPGAAVVPEECREPEFVQFLQPCAGYVPSGPAIQDENGTMICTNELIGIVVQNCTDQSVQP